MQVAITRLMKRLLGGLSALALAFLASNAAAQVAQVEPNKAAAPHTVNAAPQEQAPFQVDNRRWYGWQGLSVDAGAAVIGLSSIALLSVHDSTVAGSQRRETTAEALLLAGGVAYMAGGPTTH